MFSQAINVIDQKTKTNLEKRGRGAAILISVCILILLCIVFSDPRRETLPVGDNGKGFASYLPIQVSMIFAILFFIAIMVGTYFASKELQACFLKNYQEKSTVWCLFVALAVPQVATFINILLRVYLFADVGIELTNRIAPFFLVELFCFPVIMGALSLVLVLDKKKPNTKFNKIALPLIVAGISFTLSCLLYVAIVRTFSTVLIIVLISIFSDSGAYFIGVFFGKHKMSKYISPKKTWEGFFGGLIISLVITLLVLLMYSIQDGQKVYSMQSNFLGKQYGSDAILDTSPFYAGAELVNYGWWIAVCVFVLFLIVMSVFGDLLFSLFKRKNDIKDYGNIIAGHGGILDRFDSHLSVCFFYSIITIFCSIVSYCLGADAFFNVGFTSPLTPISNT